jgi:hypothetical protein
VHLRLSYRARELTQPERFIPNGEFPSLAFFIRHAGALIERNAERCLPAIPALIDGTAANYELQ